MSEWNKVLSEEQQIYAAIDVYVSFPLQVRYELIVLVKSHDITGRAVVYKFFVLIRTESIFFYLK